MNKVKIDSRSTRQMVHINPPPQDMRCEICGRKADDLEPFDQEFCKAREYVENEGKKLYQNCVLMYITADHKLAKGFRMFYQDLSEASWECTDCSRLSNEEAIKRSMTVNRHAS